MQFIPIFLHALPNIPFNLMSAALYLYYTHNLDFCHRNFKDTALRHILTGSPTALRHILTGSPTALRHILTGSPTALTTSTVPPAHNQYSATCT